MVALQYTVTNVGHPSSQQYTASTNILHPDSKLPATTHSLDPDTTLIHHASNNTNNACSDIAASNACNNSSIDIEIDTSSQISSQHDHDSSSSLISVEHSESIDNSSIESTQLILDDLLAATKSVQQDTNLTCYTTNQKCIVSLMRILDKMNAPDYALQTILQWAHTSYCNNCNFNPKVQTCNANLNWMQSVIQDADYLLPKEQILQLDSSTVPVVGIPPLFEGFPVGCLM